MTSKLTREWLQHQISAIEAVGITDSNTLAAFKLALAAMDSEPVAYIDKQWTLVYYIPPMSMGLKIGDKLYRHAQPAPVVPDEATPENIQVLSGVHIPGNGGWYKMDEKECYMAVDVWNACRAAMLQAGNSPVIGIDMASGPDHSVEVRYVAPPGYVIVPKEPTERMVIDGFESEPDETFSEPEVWEKYQEMSGCEQAAYRARLCWAAMIAVAPPALKQENI